MFFSIGNDRSGSDRPVCTCPKGYRGDPLVSCTRGIKKNSIIFKNKFQKQILPFSRWMWKR